MKLLVLVVLPLMAASGTNPREIFRESISNFRKDQLANLRYSHLETDATKGKEVEVSLITSVEGSPYERVLSRNGAPLTGAAEKREEEKYRRTVAERAGESPSERQKRTRKYENMGKMLDEAPDAFDFKMLPEETVGGRRAYVVELTPKPGYEPRNMRLKMFMGISAKVWIDKQDIRLVKANATVVDTIALGWVMARIEKGGHLALEQMRLPAGTWAVRQYSVDGTVRILLVDQKQLVQTVTFSTYKPISRLAGAEVAERAAK